LRAEIDDARPRDVHFTFDMNGQTIRRDEIDALTLGDPHEAWYTFGGKQMGYVGNNGTIETTYAASITDRTTATASGTGAFRHGSSTHTAQADLAPSVTPVRSYAQGSGGGGYTVRGGRHARLHRRRGLGRSARGPCRGLLRLALIHSDQILAYATGFEGYKFAEANGLSGAIAPHSMRSDSGRMASLTRPSST